MFTAETRRAPASLRKEIEDACARLEGIPVRDLTALLGRVGRG